MTESASPPGGSSGRTALQPSADNDENAPDVASSSERYALRFAGPAGEYLLRRQEAAVRRLLEHTGPAPLRVLDVGGGHMQTAPVLAQIGHSVVVHGSTSGCLFRVAAVPAEHPSRLLPMVGSMFDLPVRTRAFDLVVSIRMLGHVGRWRDLLGELCRVSDRFVLVEFASESGAQILSRLLFRAKRRFEGDTRHYATYTVPQLTRELQTRGYRVTAVDRQFMLPIVVHRMLKQPNVSRALEHALSRVGLTRRFGSPVLLLAERVTGA